MYSDYQKSIERSRKVIAGNNRRNNDGARKWFESLSDGQRQELVSLVGRSQGAALFTIEKLCRENNTSPIQR